MNQRLPAPNFWATLALAAALAALPACGKKKDTPAGGGPDHSPPGPTENPDESGTGTPGGDPPARPGSVLFPQSDPRAAANRQASQANLKTLGVAAHNFHDEHGHFPAGVYGPDGKTAGLSWRVQILPYLQQDALFKQFRLNERWDSEHNKKLIGMMPRIFAPPGGTSAVPDGYTYYRMFTGPGCLIPPARAGGRAGAAIRGLGITGITDGTSFTLLAVEAADPVVWTKPEELEYDPKKPVPKLGGVFEAGFAAVLCDGSPRFIRRTTPEATLRALITASGGELPGMLDD